MEHDSKKRRSSGRQLIALVLVVGIVAGAAWWMRERWAIGAQLASYRIGQATTYAEAAKKIAEIEQSGDSTALGELVGGWGTGNDRFDYYLARYVVEPPSSQAPSREAPSRDASSREALREAFSRELSWRPALVARWAHFWSWQVKQSPAEEIASIRGYLAALLQADPPRKLSWREVLALQAAFALTGHADAAHRLDTTNWRARFERAESGFGGERSADEDTKAARLEAPSVRPSAPLPGWKGPLPR